MAVRDHLEIRALKAQLAQYQADTVVEHNVVVVRREPWGDWAMRSDEERALMYRPCSADRENGVDVDGMLAQALAGRWVADHAIWEERGTCKSILRQDLGFWWNDTQFNFRSVADDQPPAK